MTEPSSITPLSTVRMRKSHDISQSISNVPQVPKGQRREAVVNRPNRGSRGGPQIYEASMLKKLGADLRESIEGALRVCGENRKRDGASSAQSQGSLVYLGSVVTDRHIGAKT